MHYIVCGVHELCYCFTCALQRLHLHFSFVHGIHLDGCSHLLDKGADLVSHNMYHSLYVATCHTSTTSGCQHDRLLHSAVLSHLLHLLHLLSALQAMHAACVFAK